MWACGSCTCVVNQRKNGEIVFICTRIIFRRYALIISYEEICFLYIVHMVSFLNEVISKSGSTLGAPSVIKRHVCAFLISLMISL